MTITPAPTWPLDGKHRVSIGHGGAFLWKVVTPRGSMALELAWKPIDGVLDRAALHLAGSVDE